MSLDTPHIHPLLTSPFSTPWQYTQHPLRPFLNNCYFSTPPPPSSPCHPRLPPPFAKQSYPPPPPTTKEEIEAQERHHQEILRHLARHGEAEVVTYYPLEALYRDSRSALVATLVLISSRLQLLPPLLPALLAWIAKPLARLASLWRGMVWWAGIFLVTSQLVKWLPPPGGRKGMEPDYVLILGKGGSHTGLVVMGDD